MYIQLILYFPYPTISCILISFLLFTAIVVIYILCHIWKLPLSISEAWYSIAFDTTQVTWKDYNWYNIVHDISHGLILANSAFNFILYLLL